MHSLLKTTTAGAALAAALFLSPLSLVAQEATLDDADAPGAASDPAANDESMAEDEAPADPAETGEAATSDTISAEGGTGTEGGTTDRPQPEGVAEEEPPEPEGNGNVPAEDNSERGGNQARLAATLEASEEAAIAVRDAAQRLPAIVDRVDALITKLEELPIEELVTELTTLANSANALVSSETTQALPGDLSATLAEVEAILREVREGGVVANANATLQSARASADTLPGLTERAGVLLDQAGATLQGFQNSGDVVREAERAIREVAAAADAVASLARAIENDPNSLIFGD